MNKLPVKLLESMKSKMMIMNSINNLFKIKNHKGLAKSPLYWYTNNAINYYD